MNKEKDLAILNIKVSINTKKELDDLKVHPREPYNDVIKRLLEYPKIQEITSNKKK